MQKINLLYVITKLELGGAQKQLLSLISRLDRERFNVFLFTAKTGLLLSEALSINGLRVKKSRFLERPVNPFKDLLALIEAYRFIKQNNIDIVHTHSSKAGILGRLAAKLAQVKCIVHTVHGWPFNEYQPAVYRKLFIGLERFVGKFTDKIIVVSCHDKKKGLENNIGHKDKYALICYGIDYTEFNKRGKDIKKELGIGPKDLIVTNISCFKPQKSPLDFIQLAYLVNKILPNIKFLLVGDGGLRQKIERLILRFNLQKQVILTGWHRDIPEILSATDVLVLTSLWEGLPIVALEAMATARPVVTTCTGGVEEIIVEGKTGFLFSRGDMQGMSERLIALLKDEALRKTMGKRAKDYLDDNFRLERMVNNNRDLYESLVGENGKVYAS